MHADSDLVPDIVKALAGASQKGAPLSQMLADVEP